MKKIICCLGSFFLISLIFAVQNAQSESVKAYRNAVIAFDELEYGKALKYSEDAILYRKQQINKEIEKLKSSLNSKRVQAAGDSIEAVLKILESRKETESVNIINSYIKFKSLDYYNNSMESLLKYMQECTVYPEAQKLIGDIYKLEGEYQFAEDYYLLALKNADVLDIPDEKYDILYMLAEISRLENDFEKMETRLLNILTEDKFFMDKGLNSAMISTIEQNKKGSVEKLFNLYRANSYLCIDAYNQLAEYYYDNQQINKSLSFAALSSITSFSKINSILESRNSEYCYNNLTEFFQEASFYNDIVEWGSKNNAWRSFNILAKYSIECGYTEFARELLVVLVQFSPEKYWQKDAVLMLENLKY